MALFGLNDARLDDIYSRFKPHYEVFRIISGPSSWLLGEWYIVIPGHHRDFTLLEGCL